MRTGEASTVRAGRRGLPVRVLMAFALLLAVSVTVQVGTERAALAWAPPPVPVLVPGALVGESAVVVGGAAAATTVGLATAGYLSYKATSFLLDKAFGSNTNAGQWLGVRMYAECVNPAGQAVRYRWPAQVALNGVAATSSGVSSAFMYLPGATADAPWPAPDCTAITSGTGGQGVLPAPSGANAGFRSDGAAISLGWVSEATMVKGSAPWMPPSVSPSVWHLAKLVISQVSGCTVPSGGYVYSMVTGLPGYGTACTAGATNGIGGSGTVPVFSYSQPGYDWFSGGTGTAATYPSCGYLSIATGGCELTVNKNEGEGHRNCHSDATVNCSTYTTSPSTRADNYTCIYGPYTVPISWCTGTYLPDTEPFFDPATQPSAQPSAQPSTQPSTQPSSSPTTAPVATPGRSINPDGSETESNVVTDPTTGAKTLVTRTTWPDGRTSTSSQPLNPDGTPNGLPSVVTTPATGSGTETDGEAEGCMGSWTWNPVAWVYRPVKCALQWAFVPRQSVLEPKLDAARGSLVASPFGQVGTMVGGVGGAVESLDDYGNGDCKGPRLAFPVQGETVEAWPLDACPGTVGAYVAPITKGLTTAVLVAAAVMTCAAVIGGAFGVRMPWQGGAA